MLTELTSRRNSASIFPANKTDLFSNWKPESKTVAQLPHGLPQILPTTQPVAQQNQQQLHPQTQGNFPRGDRQGVPQQQVQNQPQGNFQNSLHGDNRQPRNFQFQRNWQPARNQQQGPSHRSNQNAEQQGSEPYLCDLQQTVQDI
ncbi:unnamed protein product [Allacma fusca]|uniref:Uncharacterized protein n=1 Tax=Allacma fusca TaxID=39272 RepID=A0A8J2NK01_9HEXA|nr:unnamed protein product [Allacma fusca]